MIGDDLMDIKNKKIAVYATTGLLIFSLGAAGGYLGTRIANETSGGGGNTAQIIKTSATTKPTNDIAQVAESAAPSVVAITTETMRRGSFMQSSVSEGAGSGVIITKDGYIITNNHVVSGASSIKVTLSDNSEYDATLIGTDASNDVAVIKIDAKDLTVASIGDSDQLKVGEDVIAIGNPLGTLGGTVTEGILSATSRNITIENNEMTLLQTSAAVNPGNSGGGLFNASGELIGVVNAKISSSDVEGIGFAIPSNQAIEIAEQIIANGGFATGNYTVGITMVEISSDEQLQQYKLDTKGIYVYSVVSGSDAEEAGIKSGDRLVSINGTKISDMDKAKSLIKDSKKGDQLTIVIERDGKSKTIQIEV
ncbi:MAG: PDZ domain-containing protein [Erysipelotrichia bacterium]|nr:PDZ domain-containing protein [Erysipelotrichia bacterium]